MLRIMLRSMTDVSGISRSEGDNAKCHVVQRDALDETDVSIASASRSSNFFLMKMLLLLWR